MHFLNAVSCDLEHASSQPAYRTEFAIVLLKLFTYLKFPNFNNVHDNSVISNKLINIQIGMWFLNIKTF